MTVRAKTLVKDKFWIIEELDQTITQAKAENKSIDQVGIRFMRFCSKYDLNKISEQAQLYVEPFNARLAS